MPSAPATDLAKAISTASISAGGSSTTIKTKMFFFSEVPLCLAGRSAPLSLVREMGCGASTPAAVAPSVPVLTERELAKEKSELYLRKLETKLAQLKGHVRDLETDKQEAVAGANKAQCVFFACGPLQVSLS